MKHRYELDGLRALAITMAVLSHTSVPYAQGGWMGVDVFFVLSGYLITTILYEEWKRTETIALRGFYLRRLLRLYPALILMLAASAPFYHYLANDGTISGYRTTAFFGATYTEDFVLGLTGQPYGGLGHTWSLAIEEQFYLLWAPVLLLFLKYRLRPAIAATFGIVSSVVVLIITSTPNAATGFPNSYYLPYDRANELMLGCLLAIAIDRFRDHYLYSTFLVRFWLAPASLAGLLALALYGNFYGRQFLFPQEETGCAVLAGGLLIGLVAGPPNAPLNWIFSRRPLVWLGKISYGIYIFFIPVFEILPHYWTLWQTNYYMFLVGEMLCVVLIAAASHYLWERPFLRLKDRLKQSTMSQEVTAQ